MREGMQKGELSMIRKLLLEAAPLEFIERVSGWSKEKNKALAERDDVILPLPTAKNLRRGKALLLI